MIDKMKFNSSNEYKIMAYLGDGENWEETDIEAHKLTHINYAFVHVKDGRIIGNLRKVDLLNEIKNKNPHLKTVISVGGWGADGFSDAALSSESREIFSQSAVEFMIDNNFDGIDIDWEYPCSDQAGITARPEDKVNFTLMLKSLREKLNVLEKKNNKEYILSIAVGAADEIIEDMEMDKIHNYLDFINIMTYDMRGSFTHTTGHHANLYSPEFDPQGISADKAVKKILSYGVPRHKIILGAAFYGRMWKGVEDEGIGLNSLAETTGGHMVNYSDIHKMFIDKNGFKRHWDDASKAAYVFNGSSFISYDDEESLWNKSNYIKENNLAGIMFWEYSLDDTRTLLNSIYNGLVNK